MAYLSTAPALVGRIAELAALSDQLDEGRARRGSIALITGEPGIGKSRLAAELADLAEHRGMVTLWGHCFEGGTRSFAPWVEALSGYAPEGERGPLLDQLSEHAPVVAQLVPALRDFLGDVPAPPLTTAEDSRIRLLEAVTHVVLATARDCPLLLVLEDLHWADSPSLALLRHLAQRIAKAGVVVVGTFRYEDLHARHPLAGLVAMLRREAPCQQIELRELSLSESKALTTFILGRAGKRKTRALVDDALATALFDRTRGNPFYIQQIIAELLDRGTLVRQQGYWVAVSPPDAWGIPREVREVIERRLERLPKPAQRLLRAACAVADGFTFADAQSLTDIEDEPLLGAIDAALHAQLLRVVEPATVNARYDFAHALVRQALYTALNPDRRARLHLRTARALELGPITDELVAALATHYRLAGRFAAPERSIGYAIRAGEIAQASFAYEDAVSYWQTALDLMDANAVEPQRRAQLLGRLGHLLFFSEPDDARGLAACEQAAAIFQSLGQHEAAARILAELGARLAANMSARQDVPRALRHLRAAESMLPSTRASPVRAFLDMQLAIAYYYRLQITEALTCSQRAFDAIAGSEDEQARVEISIQHGWALAASGQVKAGQTLLIDAFEAGGRLGQFVLFLASCWQAREVTSCSTLRTRVNGQSGSWPNQGLRGQPRSGACCCSSSRVPN